MKARTRSSVLILAAAAISTLVPMHANAQGVGCDNPKQVLVIEPLNPIGPIFQDAIYPPAVTADGPSQDEAAFKFGALVVTYDGSGRPTAHGCTDQQCAADIGSVVGSVEWSALLFPKTLPAPPEKLLGELVTTQKVCLSVADLSDGPPVSVNLKGPAQDPTAIPPFSFVQSALLRIPASIVSPYQSVTIGAVRVATYPPGVTDCKGPETASALYNPATKATTYDRRLGCYVSRGPTSVMFVRNLAAVAQ